MSKRDHNWNKIQSVIVARSIDTFGQISHEIKNQMREEVLLRDGAYCNSKNGYGCGREWEPTCLEMDHIMPISMGGGVCDISNIQLLCHDCHKKKSRNVDYKAIPYRVSSPKCYN